MTEDTTGAASLLDAIENATKETLEEIQQRIQSTERVLAQLRAAEQLVAAGLGVELPKRGPGGRRPAKRKPATDSDTAGGTNTETNQKDWHNIDPNGMGHRSIPADGDGVSSSETMNERRRAVYRYLMHNGRTRQMALCEDLHIPKGSITAVLNHKWFAITDDGVELAK